MNTLLTIIKSKITWIVLAIVLWTGLVGYFFSNYRLQVPFIIQPRPLVVPRLTGKQTVPPLEMAKKGQNLPSTQVLRQPTEYETVMSQKHGEILWKIYQLETQRGLTDYCRLNKLGYGGFGVLDDTGKIVCYKSFEETAQRAEYWLTKIGVDRDLATALCTYNTGVRQPNCKYWQNFINL